MKLPRGAQAIAEARAAGKRPEGAVILSLVGPLGSIQGNAVVVVYLHELCVDWRWLLGLPTVVFYRGSESDLRPLLRILAFLTERISLWNAEKRAGVAVFPVFERGGRELHYLHLAQRRSDGALRLKRWTTSPWTASENREFAR